MSIKSKVPAAAAGLILACGLSAAATLPAGASTTQCGSACVQISSKMYGPGFVESVFQGIAAAGQPTILHAASDSDPTGDFINPLGHPVPVSVFYAEGMVSAAVNAHFGPPMSRCRSSTPPTARAPACARPWPPLPTRTRD